MKQTAIDFLLEELYKLTALSDFLDKADFIKARTMIFEIAKAMEKEQIIEAWNTGTYAYNNGQEYYTETYESNN